MSELLGGAPGNGGAAGDLIKDATIETFEKDVLEASMMTPVIVDFWATWCGPCKQLTPVLEKAVTAAAGAVRLVKIDIDQNQMLASQLRIQSVPTVYGFFQGRPVNGFQGAVPESEIKAFIDRLTAQSGGGGGNAVPGVEEALVAAQAAFEGGDVAAAAQIFAQAAQAADPGSDHHTTALAGLARVYVAMKDFDQARQIFETIPEEKHGEAEVAAVKAALDLAGDGGDVGETAALRAKVDANPADLDARFDLANALISEGDMQSALDQLLTITEHERDWNEEAARKKILTVFEALGPTHPETIRGRRKLSSILFS
ncbi:MAG: co-chaperone YbbN [Pseudomonadota bacterium]